jgi:hypothetical protein
MSKLELFTTEEVSIMLGVTPKTVLSRCIKKKIKPYKKQGKKGHFHDINQIAEISSVSFHKEDSKKEEPLVYIVHKHTQEIIIESKINKKSAVYGTHRRDDTNR